MQTSFDKIVLASASPIQNFPLGRQLLFRGSKFEEKGIEGVLLGFINLLVFKHVTRFVSCLLVVPRLMVLNRVEFLFIHGVHTPFLVFGMLARLFGRRVVVVLTDPPGVPLATDSPLARVLKRVDVWLVSRVLERADGVIALAPELINRFAIRRPTLVFPGIIDSSINSKISEVSRQSVSTEPFTIVYAGGLSKAYGIDRLLDAVAGLDGMPVRVKLFGRGDQESRIRELAAHDERIQYGGFIANDLLVPELIGADLLINPRPTQEEFAIMSFPSKLIEYLAMGRPVLTTRIPSIPDSYRSHFFFINDESAEGIRSAILSLMAMDSKDREDHALRAKTFIGDEASEKAVGKRVADFIRSINKIC
ncbi:glycosyltransferase [Cupriavidus sp. SK-3]|uniref:glycosyltransferase n=1 Tax=Cupriavidus sp. SK-3 TaxID=1470558 RepID=UPI001362CCBD|nr:glycosyltransferase [Cupriavidus sp. SK-3]